MPHIIAYTHKRTREGAALRSADVDGLQIRDIAYCCGF